MTFENEIEHLIYCHKAFSFTIFGIGWHFSSQFIYFICGLVQFILLWFHRVSVYIEFDAFRVEVSLDFSLPVKPMTKPSQSSRSTWSFWYSSNKTLKKSYSERIKWQNITYCSSTKLVGDDENSMKISEHDNNKNNHNSEQ